VIEASEEQFALIWKWRRWYLRSDDHYVGSTTMRASFGADLRVGPDVRPFFPAVLISALVGARIAALAATGLSIVLAWRALTEPAFRFSAIPSVSDVVLFAESSLLIVGWRCPIGSWYSTLKTRKRRGSVWRERVNSAAITQ
jgi:hypothetical protein